MLYNGRSKQHDNFLVERYLEDGGYCSVVRGHVTEQLPSGMNYFDVKETQGIVSDQVKQELQTFAQKTLPSIADRLIITKAAMPWKRMFEVDLEVKYCHEKMV